MSSVEAVPVLIERREKIRRGLPAQTTCHRWVDREDVTVDLFAQTAVLSLYVTLAEAEEQHWARNLVEAGASSVYIKRRPREARHLANVAKAALAPEMAMAGPAVATVEVVEGGARFEVRPPNGLSVGLYLDARDARSWVRANSQNRSMLNLFSYTCGFGLMAHLGGARRTVNVDVSRRVLDWGRQNYTLNGIQTEARDFIAGDAFEWLARFAKRGEQFELCVLDPPGFAGGGRRRFSAASDYHQLVATAEQVMAPGGVMLAMCNVAGVSDEAFDAQLRRGLGARPSRFEARFGASDVDFVNAPLKCRAIAL